MQCRWRYQWLHEQYVNISKPRSSRDWGAAGDFCISCHDKVLNISWLSPDNVVATQAQVERHVRPNFRLRMVLDIPPRDMLPFASKRIGSEKPRFHELRTIHGSAQSWSLSLPHSSNRMRLGHGLLEADGSKSFLESPMSSAKLSQ